MADESRRGRGASAAEEHLTKAQLQRRMEETRESISQTVEEIKETVTEQYESVKETVGGVLDYREQFQKEPLVWSMGALSAGFALGYTLGYAHKNAHGKGHQNSALAAFADNLIEELETVGQSLIMPALSSKIRELFGFDFSEMLEEIGHTRRESHTATERSGKALSKKTGSKQRKRAASKAKGAKRARKGRQGKTS